MLIDLDGRPEFVVFTFGESRASIPTPARSSGARAPARPGRQRRHADLGRRPPALHLLRVQRRQPSAQLARAGDGLGRAALGEQARPDSFRQRRPHGRSACTRRTATWDPRPSPRSTSRPARSLWRDRSVSRSTLIGAGEQLVLLDEDGNLALAAPGDTGLELHAKVPILEGRAWTAPTLSGTTLFVRDRRQILGAGSGKRGQRPLTPAPSVWWNRANRYCGGALVAALPVEAPPTSFHAVFCAVMPPVLPQMTALPSLVPIESLPQMTALPHDCGSVQTTLLPQMTRVAPGGVAAPDDRVAPCRLVRDGACCPR